MEVKAKLRYARVGTQKARLVADTVRGKDVNEAIRILTYMPKKSATMILNLLNSAVANAEHKKVIDLDNLYVKHISVDKGPFLKRYKPAAQGRAQPLKKKTSHINLILDER